VFPRVARIFRGERHINGVEQLWRKALSNIDTFCLKKIGGRSFLAKLSEQVQNFQFSPQRLRTIQIGQNSMVLYALVEVKSCAGREHLQ
jgi:hypothetical protein